MSYFDEAKELIKHSKKKLTNIKKIYVESLDEKIIKKSLLIEIKNFMENLRSALDYSACGIFDKYGDQTKKSNVYFPYASQSVNKLTFNKNNTIERRIPGIKLNCPGIVAKIESYQHFSNANNFWLPKFMELNNKNKHQALTPQIKIEKKELTMTVTGGPTLVFPDGVSLRAEGGMIINGEHLPEKQIINAENPLVHRDITNKIKTWTSFNFSTNNEPVLPLLENVLNGVEIIVEELSVL